MNLIKHICPKCNHSVGAHPNAVVYCIRRGEHPSTARGPILCVKQVAV